MRSSSTASLSSSPPTPPSPLPVSVGPGNRKYRFTSSPSPSPSPSPPFSPPDLSTSPDTSPLLRGRSPERHAEPSAFSLDTLEQQYSRRPRRWWGFCRCLEWLVLRCCCCCCCSLLL